MILKLKEGSDSLSLDLNEKQFALLESYINCVLEFNKSYNLMKADSADELAVNHVLDSLAGVPYIKTLVKELKEKTDSLQIGDIGSGGGCPGLPLSIALPDVQFTLVERMEKRCDFLNATIKKLGLKNVKVCSCQAEKVSANIFDIEVFRAFHPFDGKILKTLFSMLKKGGYVVAYKARAEKILAEMESVKHIVPEYKKISLTVPFLEDHERNLVVIKK